MDERGKAVEDKENYLSSAHQTHPDVFLKVVFAYTDTALQGLAKRISPHVARSLEELFVIWWQELRQITLHKEPSTPIKTIEQKVADRRLCQISINVLSHLHSTSYRTPSDSASLPRSVMVAFGSFLICCGETWKMVNL